MLHYNEIWLKRFEQDAQKVFASGSVINIMQCYRGHDKTGRPVFSDRMNIMHKFQLEKHPNKPIIVPEYVIEMMQEAA